VRLLAQVYTHVGTPDDKPESERLDAFLQFAQFLSSTTVVIIWIYKSYALDNNTGILVLETLCCLVFLAHLAFSLIASGFDVHFAFDFDVCLEAFTVTPLLMQLGGGSYLTLAYLRVYSMYKAFAALVATGMLEESVSELITCYVLKFTEFIMVTTLIAGTSFVCEALGDVPNFSDQ